MSITSPVIGFEADGQPASDALLCAIGVFLAGGADDGKRICSSASTSR
jgi:hypothetical protein